MSTPDIFYNSGHGFRINKNEKARQLLGTVPGFDLIEASGARVKTAEQGDAPRSPDASKYAERLLDGEDPALLREEYADKLAAFKRYESAAVSIRNMAINAQDSRATSFIQAHHGEIRQATLKEYLRIKSAAQKIVADFTPIETVAQATSNPDAARVFGEMVGLGQELLAWRAACELLTGEYPSRATMFPYADILKEYERAWPGYTHHTAEEEVVKRGPGHNERIGTPQEFAPWENTTDLIVDIAKRDLKLWVPSRQEHEEQVEGLRRAASAARELELRQLREQRR